MKKKTEYLGRTLGAALLLLLLLLSGCGYRIGTTPHPQIKTMAVAPVQNETLAMNASAKVRKLLCERIMTDGTYKLVRQKEADVILYVRLLNVSYSEVTWATAHKDNDILYTPNQWRVNLSGEYSAVMPGRGTPVMKGTCSGSAEFDTGPDMELGRMSGLEQAAFEMSKQIVNHLTERW